MENPPVVRSSCNRFRIFFLCIEFSVRLQKPPAPNIVVPQFGSTLNQPFALKLDRNNFSLWRTMVSAIVRGHRLDGYLKGTLPKPQEFLSSTDLDGSVSSVGQVNPAFEQWIVNDQLLLGWLYGSMTEGIACEVMGCDSSASLWTALEELFGAHSKAKMDEYRTKIQTARKGALSMADYLRQKRQWADVLALAGEPYPENQLVSNVLSGLDIEYLPMVLLIEARGSTTWQQLQDMLLSLDSKMERLHSFSGSSKLTGVPMNPSASLANKGPHPGANRGNHNNNNRGGHSNNRGSNNRSRGRGGRTSGPRPTCQVCGKYGHSAAHCYNRGASNHITSEINKMNLKEEYNGKEKVTVANGNRLPIHHIGLGSLQTLSASPLILKEILHVPSITKNLLSISKLTSDNNVCVEFLSDLCFVKDKETGQVVLKGKLKDGLYQFDAPTSTTSMSSNRSISCPTSFSGLVVSAVESNVTKPMANQLLCSIKDRWHRRLGHPSIRVLDTVLHKINVKNINSSLSFCDACQLGKSHSLPFKVNPKRATAPLELVHTDIWGPSPIMSNTNFRYYIHFIDDFSRYTWIYPLKAKSEALAAFVQFKLLVENQFNSRVKRVQTDWGGEYQGFPRFGSDHGIGFQHPCPHTSGQNGRAERKHRHIVEMGLTLLAQAHVPQKYWWDAFQTAVYLINRLPTPVLKLKTPFEVLFKQQPDYKFLKVFGVSCFPCLRAYQNHKFQFHSTKCVNLGYSDKHKGYKCLSSTGRLYISRDVIFNEDEFPFKSGFLNTNKPETPVSVLVPFWTASSFVNSQSSSQNDFSSSIGNNQTDEVDHGTPTTSRVVPDLSTFQGNDTDHVISDFGNIDRISDVQIQQHADTTTLESAADPIDTSASDHNLKAVVSTHPMITRAKAGIFKPKTYLTQTKWIGNSSEPQSIEEALQHKGWNNAMSSEVHALARNGTWKLVPRLPHMHIIDNKWVYKEKRNADGSFQRLKARLVAKGFTQRPGVDFSETFSPVIKASTVRIVLSIAVTKEWEVRQLDINNAFLNGHITEDIYMKQPLGFEDKNKPNHVCKLIKSIYGLRQAPRAWFDKLKATLASWKFKNSKADSSLFFLKTSSYIILVLIYVDDIIITGNNSAVMQTFINKLNQQFALKDLGKLHYFLGIEVNRDATGMYLSQPKYIEELLKKMNMINLKACPTPMATGKVLSIEDGDSLRNPTEYRNDRRSVAGTCVYLGDTLISWSSRKQPVVSRSSTESEYRALAQVAAEMTWVQSLLKELEFPLPATPIIWCDNMGASALASNPVYHARTKHIEIDIHFVRDKIIEKKLEVRYIPSSEQIADCLTKSLTHGHHHFLTSKLGVVPIPQSLRGNVRNTMNQQAQQNQSSNDGP
uniref:Integrase catalytic domain-containing protein n=1 Tax=Cannabis sativa TaxID=3483 RepID=A0A803PM38_CANSA